MYCPKFGKSVRIVSLVLAAVFALQAVLNVPGLMSSLFLHFPHRMVLAIGSVTARLIAFLMDGFLAAALLLFAFTEDREDGERMYLLVLTAAAVRVAAEAVREILLGVCTRLTYGGLASVILPLSSIFSNLFRTLLVSSLTAGGLYVLLSAAGCRPFQNWTGEEFFLQTKVWGNVLLEESGELFRRIQRGRKREPAPVQTASSEPLRTNYRLWKAICFSLLTCGVYGLWLYSSMARDINILCDGDGKETAGLAKRMALTVITFGIYGYVWDYSFAERLADQAGRYGVVIRERGGTILLWEIPGILALGAGPFVALHLQLKNLNNMAAAYNALHATAGRV